MSKQVSNLESTLKILWHYRMKFDPLMGKYLWLMVNKRGIEDNPEKIKALLRISTKFERCAKPNRKDSDHQLLFLKL